jgi:bleomycin hydrolase
MLLVACTDKGSQQQQTKPADDFVTDVMLRTTPVKEQGQSNLCWAYAMLATIETEHIMQGDSVDLSVAYLAYHLLADQARQRYASGGNHPITMRGMATTALHLLQLYGAMPYTSYRQREEVSYRGLCQQAQRIADQELAHRKGISHLDKTTTALLDEVMGTPPSWVFMLGCQYTPLEFAHSLYQPYEYAALTSFTHRPFGTKMVIDVPDNIYHDTFLNVPLDSLMHYAEQALRTGHPVCWEGDVTEAGYDRHQGVAKLSHDHPAVTQESRQRAFDHQQTTDDHCMAMIGIAHNSEGRKFFICKDSRTSTLRRGLVYLEEDYVRAKTIAMVIPTAALPPMSQLIPEPSDPFIPSTL